MIASGDPTRPECNGRGRIPLGRFRHNILLWERGQQLANCRVLFGIDQNHNTFARDEALESCHGFLEKSSLGNKAQELLGSRLATQRPKTFATATGKNDRVDRIEHVDAKMSAGVDLPGREDFPVSFFETRRIW